MPHYPYLIVGGGMTAAAALVGIRDVAPEASIGVISAETAPPYKRPPLSKGLWTGKPLDSIWRNIPEGVTLHLGRRAQALSPQNKRVITDDGTEYTYDQLLLATGGTPRRFPFADESVIIYYRTVQDYRRLRALTERGQRFAVIGAGFIGSEIAAALAMNGKQVTMLFPGNAIGERIFPPGLSQFLNDYYRQKGVTVWPGERIVGAQRQGERVVIQTQSGKEVEADGVVAGIGIEPNVSLAQAAGLQVDDGIVVDELLRTSHPAIYASGDVASFYSPALGKRLRVEHEDNANTMGRAAGRAMAGDPTPYHYLPFFYSDLFDLGYEAVGDVDPRLKTVEDWQEPYRKGVVYYTQRDRVRGVLLWNVWDQVDNARRLITSGQTFRPDDLKGRITG